MEDQKEEDRIRRRAYELWEPDGRAEEFWGRAIATLETEASQETVGSQPITAEVNAASTSSESEREGDETDGATGQ